MRSITRQSARLANCRTASPCASSRTKLRTQRRGVSITAVRQSDSRTPSGPPEHNSSVNGFRESQKTPENDNQKNEQGVEQENAESKYGVEIRKPSTKKSLRQQRLNGGPDPPPIPPIPEWFLRHNVTLVEERQEHVSDVPTEGIQTIKVVDTETGHTLFTVDNYEVGDSHRWKGSSYEDSSGCDSAAPGTDMAQSNPDSILTADRRSRDPLSADAESKSALGNTFINQKDTAVSSDSEQSQPQLRESEQDQTSRVFTPLPWEHETIRFRDWDIEPMRWPFLEAETSIQAAFSIADNPQHSSLYATDRVDIHLSCPDCNSHAQMDAFVHDLARVVKADLIQIDANDLEDLSESYVAQGDDSPGSVSNLGYEAYEGRVASSVFPKHSIHRAQPTQEDEHDFDEDEEIEDDDDQPGRGGPFGSALGMDLKKLLQGSPIGKGLGGRVVGIGIGTPRFLQPDFASERQSFKPMIAASNGDTGRDDARLNRLLENLLNATTEKRASHLRFENVSAPPAHRKQYGHPRGEETLIVQRGNMQTWRPDTAMLLLAHLGNVLKSADATRIPYQFAASPKNAPSTITTTQQTVVYVRDLYDIYSSKSGENVIRRLANVIKKQRRAGNRIILVGATAQDAPGPFNFAGNPEDDLPFRTITIPPCFTLSAEDMAKFGNKPLQKKTLDKPAYGRILEINIRHIQSMLRRMRPHDNLDLLSIAAYKQMNMPGTRFLTERVLSLDQVQRLALTAVGLTKLHAKSGTIQPVHLALASFVTSRSDHVFQSWSRLKEKRQARNLGFDGKDSGQDETWSEGSRSEARMERIRKSCNQHETRLLTGVVDSERIKIGFGDVHAPLETIDALKTLTSLSLLRPDAFKYGVLANDRLPGLLLYGPPGTGKTMLAKAVAKESQATVMEISGAQIYEKYVGEGEKMVRAVFSLAKKLSPCVVFIDEGDALLGSRSSAGNRNTHREIINQFLREWDGMSMDMDGHNVFIMVASNRPFDLDDAVLRRLPRRLLIDLPVAKDRESILGIHLRQESLDSTVSLNKLAEQTPFYSGSDLKNLAVSAALACVREENELSESRKDDKEFRLPEKRTLTAKHFEKALAEISASISEDMSSLTAIRKFDEQYGDRRGRRKRTGYGFGAIDSVVDESAARIRQAESSAHPPPP